MSFYYVKNEVVYIKKIYGVIYCAINITNDKKYIGQTTRELKRRRGEHIAQANNGSELAIHQAIRKYGEENFEWSIIDQAYGQKDLDDKEVYWIDYYDTYKLGGYNMSLGGQFNLSDCPEEMSAMRGGRDFLVYDMDGNFIKETMSQTEFANEIGVCVGTVNNVLLGIKSSTRGYVLFFKEDFSEDKLWNKIKQIKDRHKDFAIFTKEWEFVGIWDNKMVCAKELKISRRTIISQVSNVKIANKARGKYRFYYLENVPNELEYKIEDVI